MSQFQLPAHRDLFYGGGWHQAAGGTAATVSPSSGQALGSFAVAGAEDVDRAVAAARAGFAEWRRVAPLKRARVLREMARRLAARRDELAWIDAVDGGSPVRELRNDVDTAVAQLDFFAGLVTEMKGTSVPMGPGVVQLSPAAPVSAIHRPREWAARRWAPHPFWAQCWWWQPVWSAKRLVSPQRGPSSPWW